MQCDLDLASVAYAYVYYEKLVLMVSCDFICFVYLFTFSDVLQGKITKPIRKIVAGIIIIFSVRYMLILLHVPPRVLPAVGIKVLHRHKEA